MGRARRVLLGLTLALGLLSLACKALMPSLEIPTPEIPTVPQSTIEPSLEETAATVEIPALTAELISAETPSQTDTLAATDTPPATEAPTATEIPTATETPSPTPTATPSATPTATSTATRTVTPPQILRPLDFSGFGPMVLDINKWTGPAIARILHDGERSFDVRTYDADNDLIALLVDASGTFSGIVPLDFDYLEDGVTRRITISADGAWEIHIQPLSSARTMTVPGVAIGDGPDVLVLNGDRPENLILDAQRASGELALRAYRLQPEPDYLDFEIEEDAPIYGTFLIPNQTDLLVIDVNGPWRVEIN